MIDIVLGAGEFEGVRHVAGTNSQITASQANFVMIARLGHGAQCAEHVLGVSGILCVRLISSLPDEPFAEGDGELGLGLEPLTRRPLPFLGRVVENEI
jgi:hypothetical protein